MAVPGRCAAHVRHAAVVSRVPAEQVLGPHTPDTPPVTLVQGDRAGFATGVTAVVPRRLINRRTQKKCLLTLRSLDREFTASTPERLRE